MNPMKVARKLAPREEQIMSVVYRLEKANVAEVRDALQDPPSYSAVRTMLGQLERKGLLRRDRSGVTHFYSPTSSKRSARRSAIRRLIDTFFPNKPGDALAALIDESARDLTDEEIAKLEQAIHRAKAGDQCND